MSGNVMTDDQMEVLRKQIAAYTAISEKLVELYKSLTSQNNLSGVRFGSMYGEHLVSSGMHKLIGRQRWTPTPMQLQILEQTFIQEGSISKPKIPEITAKLLQHGQISETNVYNWFQNRRARSKRKQQVTTKSSNATELESLTDNLKREDIYIQSPIILSSKTNKTGLQNTVNTRTVAHHAGCSNSKPPMSPSQGGMFVDGSLGQIPFYEMWDNVLHDGKDGGSNSDSDSAAT